MASARRGLARLVAQLRTDDWLSPLIDGLQDHAVTEHWGTVGPAIKPSAAGSPCARDIELGMLGHHSGQRSQNRRRMDNGNGVHDRWYGYLEAAGVLVLREQFHELREPFYWRGMFDALLESPLTGTRFIAEIKSMNAFRFRKIPAQHPDRAVMLARLEALEPGYVYQLVQYIHLVGDRYGVKGDGVFIFEDTDSQDYKVRYIRSDAQAAERALAGPRAAQEAIAAGTLLSPPFPRKSLVCGRCYRSEVCYRLQDGNVEDEAAAARALVQAREALNVVR